ncbi:hypothetical protein F4677DRAFT_437270 [Hypoxylon crocopeplum]|nr:hypothetical protein F4677DRAFT_437270 [Hypoxylon crocopeplum]
MTRYIRDTLVYIEYFPSSFSYVSVTDIDIYPVFFLDWLMILHLGSVRWSAGLLVCDRLLAITPTILIYGVLRKLGRQTTCTTFRVYQFYLHV